MAVKEIDLEGAGAVYGTFRIRQTNGLDDLKDNDIGKAVDITGQNEVGLTNNESGFLGKLVDLTLTDGDNGLRLATVQICGIMTVPTREDHVPVVGGKVRGFSFGKVQASDGNVTIYHNQKVIVPAGRVLSVSGTEECTVLMP